MIVATLATRKWGEFMTSGIALALQRQKDRPDIHKPFSRPKGSKGYGEDVFEMVRDLKRHVPSLSHRQLSTLVGIATFQVRKALDNSVAREEWSEEANEASADAELAALREHHPGREYEDHPDGTSEVLVAFEAPPFRDSYRRADQSHTIPRPITLATSPFKWAA